VEAQPLFPFLSGISIWRIPIQATDCHTCWPLKEEEFFRDWGGESASEPRTWSLLRQNTYFLAKHIISSKCSIYAIVEYLAMDWRS
jgi:hypothetical protein